MDRELPYWLVSSPTIRVLGDEALARLFRELAFEAARRDCHGWRAVVDLADELDTRAQQRRRRRQLGLRVKPSRALPSRVREAAAMLTPAAAAGQR